MAGKRVAEKQTGAERGKKGWMIPVGIIAALLVAYGGFCLWVHGNGTVLPNVSIAGLDVSGMTQEEARVALETAMDANGEKAVVVVEYGDWSSSVTWADLRLTENHQNFGLGVAMDAMRVGREHLLLSGFHYLRHLLGASAQVPIELDGYPTSEAVLRTGIIDEAEAVIEVDPAMGDMRYAIEGAQLVATKGVTCNQVIGSDIQSGVVDALLNQSFPALFRGESGESKLTVTVAPTEPRTPDFNAIHAELYAEVAEPTYDKETNTVSDHVVGIDFDVNALKAAYAAAAEGETFSIPLTVTQPKDTKEAYEKKLFANVLGQATSKVSGTANRKTNVKLSAAACDGIILLPGEEFSYNNTTGSRSADKGYLPAPTYNNGASVDDVGGGICQTSSTIYYALLHTTLEVVERQNHSYATGYVPDGMDATVFFGSLDFRFKNNTNYPVKVVTESYDSGGNRYLRVKLVGTNETGRYAVPTNEVYDVVEPTKSYMTDENVPQGTVVLDKKQNAYRGRKAQVYRVIYEADGTRVESENMGVSRYKMRPHLYWYNPLDGDPATWVDGVPPQPTPVTPVQPEPPVVTPETPAESQPPAVITPGSIV